MIERRNSLQEKVTNAFSSVIRESIADLVGRVYSILIPIIQINSSLAEGTVQHGLHARPFGIWESEEKNLQLEMFEGNGYFAGRMIYFKCSSDSIMRTSQDSENPDRKYASRKLLGLKLVEKLSYQGDNVWGNGKIYDPNSGNTYEARIQLTGPNTAIVRGYWKFRWFGRSMVFNRL